MTDEQMRECLRILVATWVDHGEPADLMCVDTTIEGLIQSVVEGTEGVLHSAGDSSSIAR